MRKVIYGINLSLDGCCDHTKFSGDETILEYFTELMNGVDLIVYGRKTYELMVPYWPNVVKSGDGGEAEIKFAKAFSAIDKVVFSRSLESVEDEKARVVSADIKQEILRLKDEPGGNISLGGVDFPSQLIELGLVDEFHFVIHPVIVGEGRRLFDTARLQENLGLELLESKTLKSGCMALHYHRI